MSQCACIYSPQEERLYNKTINKKGRERVYGILSEVQHKKPVVDIERALYFTRSMKQTEGQPLVIRWAKALYHIAENITVYITPNQLLAGRAGQLGRYGTLYPELDGDFYETVLKDLENREQSPFHIDPDDIRIVMEEIAPYWKGKTYHEHLNASLPADLRGVTYADEQGLRSMYVVNEASSYRSSLQWVMDYEKVIKRGFLDIRREIQERLDSMDPDDITGLMDKKPVLESMLITCDAFLLWAGRHVALAREQAAVCTDPVRKQELLQIAEICEQVPAKPARNFREAVQSQWFVQMFERLEQKVSAVVSNGRMDQYFYPYYKKDIDEGIITREQAMELLECMWVDMSQYIDLFITPNGAAFQEGYAHWEAVTIGGQTTTGEDATNELTYLFLESKRNFPLNYPDLACRIHSRTPDRLLYEVALTIKDGTGFPKLLNDEEIIPSYVALGAPLHDAMDYAGSGCTEVRMPNRDTYTSGCVKINIASAVEMTMFNGRMLKYGDTLIGLETGDPRTFRTWEDFYEAWKKQHLNLLHKAFQQQYVVDSLRPLHFASPFSSVLHDLCVETATDLQAPRIEGGFDISYFESLGYGTVIDSLAAIKKQVFEEKRLTMQEVLDALKADFVGHEATQAILRQSPAFGNNNPYADSIAKEIDALSQHAAEECSRVRGINVVVRYVPITAHVAFGRVIAATPNGRKAGTALSEGASASHGADVSGPTANLLSNFHSKNYDLKNHSARLLNLKLSPKAVEGEEGTRKLMSMIRAWCSLKLWHLQFNIINGATLRAAQKDPEGYRGLIVRIAGYSAYFCDLSKALQTELIDRTEHSSL